MESKDLKIFKNIPELNTERLRLRKMSKKDVDDIFEYSGDSEVPKYLLWQPHQGKYITRIYLSIIESKYKHGEFYDWAVEYEGKMIGTCGFTSISPENNSAEIGYVLNRNFWGMGIAKEAALRVMKFGFEELRLNRIESKYMIENTQSKRVLEKLKMKFEGIHREAVLAKGKYRDIAVYAITASEYFEYRKLGVL